ncbi:hypothetical protein [Sandaracinus amylolyticus]|uniref:hypothetical protein n=1 Tax=Sandaracinus amylolyticus TaxID=927083 RepID=UPI001F31602E|nr:hypothetical protein [Sandaracinus amylolyticus]UJR84442.1 Hypothetical protein I5071_65210 [Sandaracinus amylolyticus]
MTQATSAPPRDPRRARRRISLVVAATCFASAWLVPSLGHGTIEEQRARLPPAAECDDEYVAGVWRSHTYSEVYRDWTVFTLTMRRVPGQPGQLVGTIQNHQWSGTPQDEEPPPCSRGGYDWIVSMDARGSVGPDNRVFFGGVGMWRLDEVRCQGGPGGYNLDNFTGVIDPSILEFQSVNNDGGRAVDEPAVFRRIRCPPVESAQSPSVNPRPPAFYPEMRGCGWL